MNQDEGSYTLSYTLSMTDFLPSHITTVEKTGRRIEQLFLMKVSDRDQNIKVNKVRL